MTQALLEIRNFGKTYGGTKKAVDNLSVSVNRGEIYGFIGRNGAGKSTTIKSVVGALGGYEGTIKIDGVSVKEDPVGCKKKIAYVPDNPNLYDYLTGIQYLNFIADVFGVPAQERKEKITLYADKFELTGSLNEVISSYSHGMKQKLAVISAFIHGPELLILDEPFVGLDPKASHILKGMMRELCDGGGAIFFSTHVLEVAEKLCDKIGIIKDGKLVKEGRTADVVGEESLEDVFLELENV